jgi:hypothetical protein
VETGAMGREIESCQGMYRVVVSLHRKKVSKNRF